MIDLNRCMDDCPGLMGVASVKLIIESKSVKQRCYCDAVKSAGRIHLDI